MTAKNRSLLVCLTFFALFAVFAFIDEAAQPQRHLYVALPGPDDTDADRSVRLLVFDIANHHRFVRRIPLWPPPRGDSAETVRGIAAHGGTGRLYVSTTTRLAAIDVKSSKVLWSRSYDGHCCDRFAVSPDGRTIHAPAFGSAKWYVVDAATGELRASIGVTGWPRHTIASRDGKRAFLAAWDSPLLSIADAATHEIVRAVGPFSASLCPFAVNAKETLAFANVDRLVGFEVGDLQTGLILDRVEVAGFDADAAKEYECPSHGIAFAPGDRELWVADGVRNRLVVFDATVYPPVQRTAVDLQAQPRWLTFSADGRFAYPSTGDIVDTATKRIVGVLEAPPGVRVNGANLVEIDRPPS